MKSLYLYAGVATLAIAAPVWAQEHDHSTMDHGDIEFQEVIGTDCFKMSNIACLESSMKVHGSPGSGTSLLPKNEGESHSGLHIEAGDDWMLMLHGFATGVYTDQSGPRGDDKAYVQSMAMLSAEKDTNWGRIQLKSMMSLEPLMSNRGYPNLFATGETAGGEPLVDRQHPHDLFMELAGRVDFNVGEESSVFIYGGPAGEPALGPSALCTAARQS